MSSEWPVIPLGQVIEHRKEFIEIDDLQSYKRCRVQLHAQGIVLRDVAQGAEIKTKKQQVCHAGEFLVAEIDAKVGGFGIVPSDLDGAIVSSHYFLYGIKENALERPFLDYFIRTPAFREQVGAKGTTNYAAIRPKDVLDYKIPLPPLAEQQRIIARIDELAAKIEEARSLRRLAEKEAQTLFKGATKEIFAKLSATKVRIEELVGRANLKNGKSVKSAGISSGISCLRLSALRNGKISYLDTKPVPMTVDEARPYFVSPGDIFVVRGNGSKELVGQAGIAEGDFENVIFPDLFIRVPLDRSVIDPSYFVAWWNSLEMRKVIEETAKTTSGIWKINQGHMASFSIPIPPLAEQHFIVDYLANLQSKVDSIKRLQSETAAELDALMPSILDQAFKGEL